MLVSFVLNGLAVIFRNVGVALTTLFGAKKLTDNAYQSSNAEDYEVKSDYNEDGYALLNKKEILSYKCEKCNQLNFSVISISAKKRVNPTNPGQKAREKAREQSYQQASTQFYEKQNALHSGIEKAITQNIYIYATCSHCEIAQSWSKKICSAISIKSFIILLGFLSFLLGVILAISLSGAISQVLLALAVASIPAYYMFRGVSESQVRKGFDKLTDEAKPQIVKDNEGLENGE